MKKILFFLFTCALTIGSVQANEQLAARRAEELKAYLVREGNVPPHPATSTPTTVDVKPVRSYPANTVGVHAGYCTSWITSYGLTSSAKTGLRNRRNRPGQAQPATAVLPANRSELYKQRIRSQRIRRQSYHDELHTDPCGYRLHRRVRKTLCIYTVRRIILRSRYRRET